MVGAFIGAPVPGKLVASMRTRGATTRRRAPEGDLAWGLALALGLGLSGCLVELDRQISCGDGYVDFAAGEECDPADVDSFIDACRDTRRPEGFAACDPVKCTIIDTREQCMVCGDGFVDGDEQCDGDNLDGRKCRGALQCTSDCRFDYSECDLCGNGVRDLGEECDPRFAEDILPNDLLCEHVPPLQGIAYTSGRITNCSDCQWDRSTCGYCGNGVRDGELPVAPGGVTAPEEWCDPNGGTFDIGRLEAEMGTCETPGQRRNVGCGDDCRHFVERPGEERCCWDKNQDCPGPDETTRCCYEYDHPTEDPCEEFFEGPSLRRVCR